MNTSIFLSKLFNLSTRRHEINGCPYPGDIFTIKNNSTICKWKYSYIKTPCCCTIAHVIFVFSLTGLEFYTLFFNLFLNLTHFSFVSSASNCTFYQRPQRPRWPPLSGPLCPHRCENFPYSNLAILLTCSVYVIFKTWTTKFKLHSFG